MSNEFKPIIPITSDEQAEYGNLVAGVIEAKRRCDIAHADYEQAYFAELRAKDELKKAQNALDKLIKKKSATGLIYKPSE